MLYAARFDESGSFQLVVNVFRIFACFLRMRAVIIIKVKMKTAEGPVMFVMHAGNQSVRRDAFFFGAQHDRGAMGIVGANIIGFVSAHFLEAHPNVGLDIFNQMAQVDVAVRIG